MKKAIIIILAALLMLCVFVACDNEDIIDSLLGYMVTFDANGGEGEMESQTIPANGSTLNPNTFTRKDYYFLCWNTQEDGEGTSYVDKAEIKLTEGITLYAQWEHSESVITFDANGGEGEMEMQTVLTNVPTELYLNEFTKEYYMFGSWNTDPDGEGESFEDGEAAAIEGNVTLYAQWVQPLVIYDANGGTGEMEPQAVPYGVATELEPVGTIEREGYEFVEWNTESDGTGDDYDEGDEVTLTEDLILYAMWKGDKVQVKFDSTGGAVVKKVLEVVVGLPYGDELPQKSIKKNYEFDGWYTKAEGGTEVDEYTIVTNPYDHTLYAHWKPATYEINYELKFKDAVIDPSEDVREYEYGVGATLPSKVTKEGYVFNGWYDNDTYQGEPVTAVSETDSGDKTFYARWKKTGVEYLTATTTTWQDGYTYSLDPKTTDPLVIADRITVTGDVTLILPDGKTLNASKGITVSEGNTLVIDKYDSESTGTGILNATATQYGYAGIGGGYTDGYRTAGTITVKYGTVTATGGESAAGIGGGYNGAGGTITISGGTVKADGGSSAAGIGGGTGDWQDHSVGAGGIISISGGDITATGGDGGAGIGGGLNGDGGTLSVSDGTVVANGVNNGAGIGGGAHADGGKVTIEGGTVSATGKAGGAGIGGGGNYNGDGGVGADVTIKGGVVTATGGVSAVGIGAGNGSSDHGDLTIADGVIMMVSANNSYWSVYDGSTRKQYMKVPEPIVLTSSTTAWTSGNVYTLGDEDVEIGSRITVSGSVGLILPDGRKLTASKGITVTGSNSLTINGGTGQNAGILEATGGDRAAGIGGGYQEVGGEVTINGGTVTANGGEGAAGIGGGWYGTTGGTVTINGGTVEAIGGSISGSSGGAGIGGGYYGVGGTVTINNGTVTATGVSGGAGIGGGYYKGGGTVTITGGSVTANGGQNAYGIGRGYDGGSDGTLTLTGVTMQVKDSEEASWESYVEDVRHRYMKADEGI